MLIVYFYSSDIMSRYHVQHTKTPGSVYYGYQRFKTQIKYFKRHIKQVIKLLFCIIKRIYIGFTYNPKNMMAKY
jgi:hypothetical protein